MIKCLKKYFYFSNDILRKLKTISNSKFKNIKTTKKSLKLNIILKNSIFYIYNGKKYILLNVNYKKIGLKAGDFIKTKN
uniref:30S ribosomal protein S19 n=1 Tax=Nephromyces sp. ex Molgula occidentalis TaxID=2544991 RepID=A0A5C1H7T3_9APIC|nr:30S ribosomal protein S19 [Nephromyces sp. ex Molgula occidentalis]